MNELVHILSRKCLTKEADNVTRTSDEGIEDVLDLAGCSKSSRGTLCTKTKLVVRPRLCLQGFHLAVPASSNELAQGGTQLKQGTEIEKDLNETMNSTDSLNYINSSNVQEKKQANSPPTVPKVDTLQQGSENQESPGAGSTHSSVSPPLPILHEITISNPQQTTIPVTMPQFCAPAPTALNSHQILVDPATGQHFLVSSAPPPPRPQIIYQPVYYSAAPAQPAYYAFVSGGGYVFPATPLPAGAQPPSPQIPPVSSHMALGQTFSSSPPPTGITSFPQSIADVDETRSVTTIDDRYSVYEQRLKIGSRMVEQKQPLVSKNSSSPPLKSPIFGGPVFDSFFSTPSINQQRQTQVRQQVLLRPNGLAQSATSVPGPDNAHMDEGERTPLYGAPPSWWGETNRWEKERQNVQSDPECTKSYSPPSSPVKGIQMNASSDSEASRLTKTVYERVQPVEDSPVRRPLKSIRMDIDLNEPIAVEETSKEKSKVFPRASSSTAFTVSFDNEEGSTKANLSLQDAAKKSGTTRRFMRRNVPTTSLVSKGTAAKIAGLTAASKDPKQYLLNKMLMGVAEESVGGPEMLACCEESEKERDIDTLSEAGTYVVEEGDQRLSQMVTSQHIKDSSDAGSVSSESTTTQGSETGQKFTESARMSQGLPQINESVNSIESGAEKDDHLCEFMRLASPTRGQRHNITSGGRQNVAISTPTFSNTRPLPGSARLRTTRRPESGCLAEEKSYTSHRLCTLVAGTRSSLPVQPHRSQPGASGTGDIPFRRGDGGRFSMRFSGMSGTKASPSMKNERPPFRVGGGSGRVQAGGSAQKESAEMVAWLRRKDYNPMKAAAEAKKLQQLKARADKFMSSRSISFHQGARPFTAITAANSGLSNSRHNRSQDDLSADDAACGPETILASYSKGITRDLNKLRSSETPEANINNLENSVKQLTVKCNRSIELIKNLHQGQLSNSVENLLEMTIEPVKDRTGTVTDQLDRLSAAFDAIQKYLEASTSASLPPSPSSKRSPAAASSSYSPLSTSPSRQQPRSAYQSKLAAAKRTSSDGQQS